MFGGLHIKGTNFHIFDPPSAFFGIPISFIDVPQNTNHFLLVNPKHLPRPVQVKVYTGYVSISGMIHECKDIAGINSFEIKKQGRF
jgi:hypothetical protein